MGFQGGFQGGSGRLRDITGEFVERSPFHEELSDRAEVLVCLRADRRLFKAAFMARLNHVLMEERAYEILRSWGCFGLSLYLEVPEGQRSEKYCKKLGRWVP